jgi:hypothetical protein
MPRQRRSLRGGRGRGGGGGGGGGGRGRGHDNWCVAGGVLPVVGEKRSVGVKIRPGSHCFVVFGLGGHGSAHKSGSCHLFCHTNVLV